VGEVKRFIDSPKQRLRGNYLRAIDIWRSCYPAEQVFVGFYDDILQNPEQLLAEICRFPGIRRLAGSGVLALNEKKNVSGKRDIPAEVLFTWPKC
jgi:hypothetical protein